MTLSRHECAAETFIVFKEWKVRSTGQHRPCISSSKFTQRSQSCWEDSCSEEPF
jgi:hypothetical protein